MDAHRAQVLPRPRLWRRRLSARGEGCCERALSRYVGTFRSGEGRVRLRGSRREARGDADHLACMPRRFTRKTCSSVREIQLRRVKVPLRADLRVDLRAALALTGFSSPSSPARRYGASHGAPRGPTGLPRTRQPPHQRSTAPRVPSLPPTRTPPNRGPLPLRTRASRISRAVLPGPSAHVAAGLAGMACLAA